MRHITTALAVALLVGCTFALRAQDGPLTNAANLLVRTDANGYVIAAAQDYDGPDGPLQVFANTLVRTDANGYLIITNPSGFGGGSGAPDDAQYWVGAADATLTAEIDLSALATALVVNTAGTPSAYAGTNCTNQFLSALSAVGAGTCESVSVALDDLTDVTITSADAGDYVRYSGAAWVDVAASQIVSDINGSLDHGTLSGLGDDDHTQYLLADGSRALSADWDAGSQQIRAETFQSDVATGTAPFTVASTTLVTNLSADLLDAQEGSFYRNAGNLNAGTVPVARLSFTAAELNTIVSDDNVALLANANIYSAAQVINNDVTVSASGELPLEVFRADSGTADVQDVFQVARTSSGTVAAGFGARYDTILESASGTSRTAARQDVTWNVATDASRTTTVTFSQTTGASALDTTLQLEAGHVGFGGFTPSVSSCGSGPSISGNDNVAIVTPGGAATSCTITFANTWGSAPVCTFDTTHATAALYVTALSTTAVTVGAVAGSVFYMQCFERV